MYSTIFAAMALKDAGAWVGGFSRRRASQNDKVSVTRSSAASRFSKRSSAASGRGEGMAAQFGGESPFDTLLRSLMKIWAFYSDGKVCRIGTENLN